MLNSAHGALTQNYWCTWSILLTRYNCSISLKDIHCQCKLILQQPIKIIQSFMSYQENEVKWNDVAANMWSIFCIYYFFSCSIKLKIGFLLTPKIHCFRVKKHDFKGEK
jgi:hypothetical protein